MLNYDKELYIRSNLDIRRIRVHCNIDQMDILILLSGERYGIKNKFYLNSVQALELASMLIEAAGGIC